MRLRSGVLVAATTIALVASGCASVAPDPSGTPARPSASASASASATASATGAASSTGPLAPLPAIPAALASFYSQTLAWTTCAQGECATASVPLDYGNPGGTKILLPLARKKATKTPRLGTLFLNPGGPGGSGVVFLGQFATAGLEQYDIVGWDPRGVGGSSQIRCMTGADADAYVAMDLSPETPAEASALVAGSAKFGASCLAGSGKALLSHVSTQESARDLDILRAAVGDVRLNYYGASYGTLIGALYAEFFPGRVGRMVLDSAVNITGRTDVPQVLGFERAFNGYVDWCVASRSCEWGTTSAQVRAALVAWLAGLDAHPLAVGSRSLTQSQAAMGIATGLYAGALGRPVLKQALARAKSGDGSLLLLGADALVGRSANGGYSSLFSSAPAITCADRAGLSVDKAEAGWVRDKALAPFFGYYYGPDLMCSDWPVAAAPTVAIRAAGAPTILVVGATGDPVTPYEYAVDMAKQLASGVLLTYDGASHVSYGGHSDCVDAAVRRLLVEGTAPALAAVCQ